MEEVIILGGLALLAIPVCIIILFFMYSSQKARVAALDRRVESLEMELDEKSSWAAERVAETPAVAKKAAETPLKDTVRDSVPDTVQDTVQDPVKKQGGPWKPTKTPLEKAATDFVPKPDADTPPPAYVFRKEKTDALTAWLKENWFYAVAAVSLALAGVFFVQYGIENGYLTPFWRVMGALGLGACLITAGEFIRRKTGDGADSHTEYLPSVFSGAGLVALFAGVLAARHMYGLIGPDMALIGLVCVSLLAMVLGWYYGPLLAAVGIIGAMAAPFLIASNSGSEQIYYYFAMVTVMGLLIDAVKRWAWVSVLTLGLGFAAAWVVFSFGVGGPQILGFALIAAIAAVLIPPLQRWPHHSGEMVTVSLMRFVGRKPAWPEFTTRVAMGGFVGAVAVVSFAPLTLRGTGEDWPAVLVLCALMGMAIIWFWRAPALRDAVIFPPLGLLFITACQAVYQGGIYRAFTAGQIGAPEASPPWDLTLLAVIALVGSLLIFWRGMHEKQYRLFWAGGAALFAPLMFAILDVAWPAVSILGRGEWAWHAMVVAIAMTIFAVKTARMDGDDHKRTAIFALSAVVMISYALVIMLSDVALTLAIAVMVALSAFADRKLDLKLLTVFVQVGAVATGYRLIVDPGVFWAISFLGSSKATWPEFLLVYGGVLALFAATWYFLQFRQRFAAIVVAESAVWSLGGVFATLIIFRLFDDSDSGLVPIGLLGLVWLISAANQLYRTQIEGKMRIVRWGLAILFGMAGLLALGVNLTVASPLYSSYERIRGPFIFDTLMLAYLFPAAVMGLVALKFTHLQQRLRVVLGAGAAALTVFYVGLEIRRFWQGDILYGRGTTDGELYSYTIAMLLVSVGLLFFAFSRRSVMIRKIAMVGIGLTIAKVFLIDMSGLQGLIRVFSFLGLGLSLAGLAWVSRQMTQQWDVKTDKDEA